MILPEDVCRQSWIVRRGQGSRTPPIFSSYWINHTQSKSKSCVYSSTHSLKGRERRKGDKNKGRIPFVCLQKRVTYSPLPLLPKRAAFPSRLVPLISRSVIRYAGITEAWVQLQTEPLTCSVTLDNLHPSLTLLYCAMETLLKPFSKSSCFEGKMRSSMQNRVTPSTQQVIKKRKLFCRP